MGQRARKVIDDKYNLNSAAQKYYALIKKIQTNITTQYS
jgi:hypothetical protein